LGSISAAAQAGRHAVTPRQENLEPAKLLQPFFDQDFVVF
jgi:hypothetical protein